MEGLTALLQDELKDIYDAEKQLTKALPKLIKKATSEELKLALEAHLGETEGHVERLEQAFEQLNMPAKGKKCEGMKHLIDEGSDMISEADDDWTRDAIIVAAAQKAEHYEIASYGTIRTWANLLGKNEVASLAEDTLEEEKAADQKLTTIAESFVNELAADEDEEEETAPMRGRQTRGRAGSRTRAAAADRARRR